MFGRFSNYRLRMRNLRQKYLTLMRKKISVQRTVVIKDLRNKIFKGLTYSVLLGASYYYGNQIYSQYHEIKQVKAKIFRDYPQQVCFIGIGGQMQDIKQIIEQDLSSRSQNNQGQTQHQQADDTSQVVTQEYKKFIINLPENQTSKILKDKLGSNITIFTPRYLDQLCNIVELCHKYRHKVLSGNFQIQLTDNFSQKNVVKSLQKVSKPARTNKYIIVDLSQMKKYKIDHINSTMELDVGLKCKQINKKLQSNGYCALFPGFLNEQTMYDVIVNNYPLEKSRSLIGQLINLTLVSASGVKFRSSTEVQSFGQIPNLTSLFVGTGGAFSIPAQAKIKIKIKKSADKNQCHSYELSYGEINQMVLNLREIKQYLNAQNISYSIDWKKQKLILQVEQAIPENIFLQKDIRLHKVDESKVVDKQYEMVFAVNNSILQELLLNSSLDFNSEGGVLYMTQPKIPIQSQYYHNYKNNLSKFVSSISLGGGVLIWSKNGKNVMSQQSGQFHKAADTQYQHLKKRMDVPQVGAELMKKIVQVRQGIDRRHILDSHQRYEKYYKKNMFRKMTEFFW